MTNIGNFGAVTPDAPSGPSGREKRAIPVFLVSFVMPSLITACAAVWLYSLYNTDRGTGNLILAPTSRVTVSIGELLSTLITLSALTIPVIVAYLLVRGDDLCTAISTKAVNMLGDSNITPDQCHRARLFRQDEVPPWTPMVALSVLSQILRSADSFQRGHRYTNSQVRWMFIDRRKERHFRFFEAKKERTILCITGAVVGILTLISFLALFLRLVGIQSTFQDVTEIVVVTVSCCSNVCAYLILIWVVISKSMLVGQFALVLENNLPDIVNAIRRVEAEAKAMDATHAARLKREREVLEKRRRQPEPDG